MRPRADEIVQSILWTFDTYIAPEVKDPFAKSLALTISNLLRLVALRIQREGSLLYADNREIRQTLRSVQALLAASPQAKSEAGLYDLSQELESALAKGYRGPEDYATLESLTDEATDLRWALDRAIRVLDEAKERLTGPAYQNVREEIRTYLRRELDREGSYIREAFVGERR